LCKTSFYGSYLHNKRLARTLFAAVSAARGRDFAISRTSKLFHASVRRMAEKQAGMAESRRHGVAVSNAKAAS
jgi:hypothetical protein